MNKYQKQFHKEIKELLTQVGPKGTYKGAKRYLKRKIRYTYEPSPCSNCWNGCNKQVLNKIVYCKNNT